MIGGLLKSASRLALVAAAGVIAGGVGAQAADLGGNCCADLEERVAELEATTARKGTRRMGLQLYGQVSEVIAFWDDGGERNTYVEENSNIKNRFGAQGSAKINSDWSAGFKLEWEVRAFRSNSNTQLARGDNEGVTHTTYNTQSLSLRHAHWYLKSDSLGTVSVGQQDDAVLGIFSINLAAPDGFTNTGGGFIAGAMRLRASNGAPGNAGLSAKTWGNTAFIHHGDGPSSFDMVRMTSVRYTTPVFAGFSASASWGEDDVWSAGLRYAGELGPFRLAAGIGYEGQRDDGGAGGAQCANLDSTPATPTVTAVDCHTVQAGASLMHTPTGLYVSGGWAQITDDNRRAAATIAGLAAASPVDDSDTMWWVQVGWEAKLNALGRTTFWGEYNKFENGFGVVSNAITTLASGDVLNPSAGAKFVQSTEATGWGIGITQDIDAAAMKLYIGYWNFSVDDITLVTAAGATSKARPVDDFNVIFTGATVRF